MSIAAKNRTDNNPATQKGRIVTENSKIKISKANRKVSDNDLLSIKKYINDGTKLRDIALMFDISPTTVTGIKLGHLKYAK